MGVRPARGARSGRATPHGKRAFSEAPAGMSADAKQEFAPNSKIVRGRRPAESDLLISPRSSPRVGENRMIRERVCGAVGIAVRGKDAAASTADLSRGGDGDQPPDRRTNGGRAGVLSARPLARVPAREARRAKFPHVYQPD